MVTTPSVEREGKKEREKEGAIWKWNHSFFTGIPAFCRPAIRTSGALPSQIHNIQINAAPHRVKSSYMTFFQDTKLMLELAASIQLRYVTCFSATFGKNP